MKSEYIRVKEKTPFLGKGVDDVIAAVRSILTLNKYVQKLILEIGKPILFERMVPKDEAPEDIDISLHDQIRAKPMAEYTFDEANKNLSAFQHLWDMNALILGEGLRLSHIAVGDKFDFQRWLKVSIPITQMSFFGLIPIVPMPELEHDVFILCGSDEEGVIQFSMKFTIP